MIYLSSVFLKYAYKWRCKHMNCNMSELYCYTVKIDGKTIYVDRDDAKSQEEAEIIARNSKPFDLEAYLNQHKKQN